LAVLVSIIIGREITISALREWLAEIGDRRKVAVSLMGKLKTVLQMSAITWMLWGTPLFGIDLYFWGYALLVVAAALTLWSMVLYLRAAAPSLMDAGQGPGSGQR
jgi:CDP-diacylglycerol--glycerol-3-phosphate 3-phosphatidyltransferase (EC 2.7.8.5)